MFYVSLKYQ